MTSVDDDLLGRIDEEGCPDPRIERGGHTPGWAADEAPLHRR